MPLSVAQSSSLFYLLVGSVGIQAVFKASWPFNKIRAFLCVTMSIGFFVAVFLFHSILQVALPTPTTIMLFFSFAIMSFLLERVVTAILNRLGVFGKTTENTVGYHRR